MNWNNTSSSADYNSFSSSGSGASSYDTSNSALYSFPSEEINGLPAALNPETRGRLNDVRRELWMGSARGLAFGLGLGFAGHHVATRIPVMRAKLSGRNSLVLTTVICGTTCSYIGAVVYGQNAFSYLVDLFKAEPKPDTLMVAADSLLMQQKPSNYQAQLIQNDREVIDRFEQAFARRAEAIQRAKQTPTTAFTGSSGAYSTAFPTHFFSSSSTDTSKK